jgi:hypothetical protein
MLNVMNLSLRRAVFMLISVASVSFAQDADTISKAITTLYEQIAFVDAYKTFCDTAVPDSSATNTQAVTSWKTENNVAQIEQLATQFAATSPEAAQALQTIGATFQTQFAERFSGQEATACANLPALLQNSSLTALYPQEMQLLPNITEMFGQATSESTITSGQNNPLANASAPPTGAGGLSGLYNYYSSDYSLGVDGSVIPDPPKYWYFFPDGYVYKGTLGHETVNCAANMEDCDTYVISGSTITFGDGDSKTFSQSGDTLLLGDQEWSYIKPESFTLEGSYESTYGGSEFLNITTFTFRDDGTFSLEGAAGVISVDEQDNGDGTKTTTTATGYNENANTGSYIIRDNNIILSYTNGEVKTLAFDYFESAEEGVYGVYIGGTLYY